MKKALWFPFLALLVFVLIVSTACGFSLGNNGDATEKPQVIVVTATPERQAPVVSTDVVTEAPATSSEPQAFFLEEFDTNMDNYSWFDMGSGDEDGKMNLAYEDGQLKIRTQ